MPVIKSALRRLSLLVVPPLYRLVAGLLFGSCRVRESGRELYDDLTGGGAPFVAVFWHYSIFYFFHRVESRNWVAMVSGSDDAEYVSQLLRRLGVDTVRGSRRKGGLAALKTMAGKMTAEGKQAAIVADGSQGPARRAQAGAVLLASRTGAPILPVAWGADRYWAFGSWDRTVIPKPFARLFLCFGEPLRVPAGIGARELEAHRLQLERRLNELYERAWGEFGLKEH